MKRITLWLLQYHLKVTKKNCAKADSTIIKQAYGYAIKNFEDSIMYLKSQIHSEK